MQPLDAMNFIEDDCVYELDMVTAGILTTGFIQIQGDSWFRWTKSLVYKNPGGEDVLTTGAQPIPAGLVQIRDLGSQRDLFRVAVPIASVFGGPAKNKSTAVPFILPLPRLFKPKSSFQVSVSYPAGAAVAETLFFQFVGTKCFNLAGAR